VVTDLGGLSDHGEAMVDEEVAADLRARMDVDRSHPARPVIDGAREEEPAAAIQAVRDPVIADRPHAGVKENFQAGAWRGIARFDRIEIRRQTLEHGRSPCWGPT